MQDENIYTLIKVLISSVYVSSQRHRTQMCPYHYPFSCAFLLSYDLLRTSCIYTVFYFWKVSARCRRRSPGVSLCFSKNNKVNCPSFRLGVSLLRLIVYLFMSYLNSTLQFSFQDKRGLEGRDLVDCIGVVSRDRPMFDSNRRLETYPKTSKN